MPYDDPLPTDPCWTPSPLLHPDELRRFAASCITIGTRGSTHTLGDIAHGEMSINDYGMIAKRVWLWLDREFPSIRIDAFSILPTHLRGILAIRRSRHATPQASYSLLDAVIDTFKKTSQRQMLFHPSGDRDLFWQEGYHAHDIRTPEEFSALRRLILQQHMLTRSEDCASSTWNHTLIEGVRTADPRALRS